VPAATNWGGIGIGNGSSEVCLVAPRAGFARVPCGHARFCESCAMRVSDMDVGCLVCRADNVMRIFFLDDRLCRSTLATFSRIIVTFMLFRYFVSSKDTYTVYNNTHRWRRKLLENGIDSSYNTPSSKHKIVVSSYSNTETSFAVFTLVTWFRVFSRSCMNSQWNEWWQIIAVTNDYRFFSAYRLIHHRLNNVNRALPSIAGRPV